LRIGPEGEAAPYEKVVVVGHSLGSVIAYDALNRLILEDIDSNGGLHVAERTALFLTFGSPLDKTAFIFGAQGHDTTEAREALAAAVQPLIQAYRYRPGKWINIYSPWDIISGSLDLYDLPTTAPAVKDPKAVCNQSDPDATTLLMAHTEYWTNELLVQTLYDAL
jgi:pimeloyl-ACP methyl ester carboxylesterase